MLHIRNILLIKACSIEVEGKSQIGIFWYLQIIYKSLETTA